MLTIFIDYTIIQWIKMIIKQKIEIQYFILCTFSKIINFVDVNQ